MAAECYARDLDELETQLRLEVELSRAAFKAGADADYCARRDAHGDNWTGHGLRPDPRLQDEIETEWRDWVNGAAS